MPVIVKDRVKETSTTTGIGAFTLAGAMTGFVSFASIAAVNDTFYYTIQAVDSDGNPTGAWETGVGTYSAANTLTRTTVVASTNANAAVNFAAGTKQIWLDLIAAGIVYQNSTGSVGIGTTVMDSTFNNIGDVNLGRRGQTAVVRYMGLPGANGVFSNVTDVGTTGIIITQTAAGDTKLDFKVGKWGGYEKIAFTIDGTGVSMIDPVLTMKKLGINVGTAWAGQLEVIKTDSVYNSERTATLGLNTGTDGQAEMLLSVDNTSTIAVIQTATRNTSWGGVPLVMQPNGGRIAIGTITDDGVNRLQVTGDTKHTGNVLFDANGTRDIGAAATGIKRLYADYTNTATVGNVTINKISGRVNLGAGATTLTVQNTLVTAASHIFLNSDGAPGNLVAVLFYAVPAAGSFTVNASPGVTNQTAIDFFVVNAD